MLAACYASSMGLSASRNDINVTPLIDVLLVLLVIFLVVMPVMMRMETFDIPRKEDGVDLPSVPVVLNVHADLSVSIDEGPPLLAADLAAKVRAMNPKLVFVGVDDGVPWNDVSGTVDTVRGATDGATVAIKTE